MFRVASTPGGDATDTGPHVVCARPLGIDMNPDPAILRGWYSARAVTAAEWAPAIMWALRDGPLHYRALLAAVRGIEPSDGWPRRHQTLHDSILARSLKRLVDDGLICRDENRTGFPPAVCYALTDAGHGLLRVAASLAA